MGIQQQAQRFQQRHSGTQSPNPRISLARQRLDKSSQALLRQESLSAKLLHVDDAGSLSCILGNNVGSVTATRMLKMRVSMLGLLAPHASSINLWPAQEFTASC